MKNLKIYLTFLFALFLASCSTTLQNVGGFYVRGYDFIKYTEQGFLFTPETYLGTYDSIGLIHVDFIPEVREAQTPQGQRPPQRSGYDRITHGGKYYYVQQPNTEDIIDHLYELSVEMGANAVTNFNVSSRSWEGVSDIRIVTVSGFAILRTDM